ncbi:aminopeptidase P family protein [Qingshengfaniella alkalisoli]|uniref:Aminopeptidase P family protein n=1 Tax=Qingshengfaniella alkalisoli TaxID=2599296 RepID=A0A5B8IT59_9RHOB|nr:aminopeptidase P family protein [Qingshengfaniella alkalisoli]QDY69442.1 aminopeptidase P family protein [Qingshengfaniella alkalisoli]
MFQSFETTSHPELGAARLNALRAQMKAQELDGFLIPRADAFRGEVVAPHDERLSWLTGFTGSAGFAAVLADKAGVFIDGRYTVQVRGQVDLEVYTPVNWPATKLQDWLRENATDGAVIGFDPWLHTRSEITQVSDALTDRKITFQPTGNLVDVIWDDQPKPPMAPVTSYPDEFAGRSSADKRAQIAGDMVEAGQSAVIITLPESIAWLLNIRGADITRTPFAHAFAILHADTSVDLFIAPQKLGGVEFPEDVRPAPFEHFAEALGTLSGKVLIDKSSAPFAVSEGLEQANVEVVEGTDPCALPRACKTEAEIAGSRAAHRRDAIAMVEFLAWLDEEAPKGTLTEIDVATTLEGYRRATNQLKDISFETIAGSGPNAAMAHYRVTEQSNRTIRNGELLLVDSGGQYLDGTTDITRTVTVGEPTDLHRRCFTLVLKGMIAVSRARWPEGLAGRDLDPLARYPLWLAGLDYDHGTGHGVGAYLSVHEGPQRISRTGEQALEPGMILSNEPGYYREGDFGIRTENLLCVTEAPALTGADDRRMLSFETLTFVPIDRRLIDTKLLDDDERNWLDSYHRQTRDRLIDHVSEMARTWLLQATEPL